MRIVFFGTSTFAVPSLERLLAETDFTVTAVVTQPDRPQGRGNKLTPPPVKVAALARDLPVWQPERLRRSEETLEALVAERADFFVVAAYGQILPQRVLDMPTQGCINVHGSLLPRYRGAAPVQWAIYHGETVTGVTTMRMEAGLDTGPMLLKVETPIEADTNSETLLARLATLGAPLLIETLRNFSNITPEVQDDGNSSYAPLISKEQYQIDWSRSAVQISNQVRAFYPYTFTLHRENRLRLLSVSAQLDLATTERPGLVIALEKSLGFLVSTGEGALLVKQVQPAGGKAQPAADYANGCRMAVGERFGP